MQYYQRIDSLLIAFHRLNLLQKIGELAGQAENLEAYGQNTEDMQLQMRMLTGELEDADPVSAIVGLQALEHQFNLELALADNKAFWYTLVAHLTSAQRERIDEVLSIIDLAAERAAMAGSLSHGQKQWLEIGMLLMQDPELLLVDEPVAGMTPQETERTGELLLSLAGKHSVIVVEHDMDFIRSIAERVTVLHEGRVIAEGNMDTIQNDQQVVEVYLGA